MAAGWLSLAIGVIGIAVPLLPTVPFLLLAAYCFEKGSPELHDWIISHPTFGSPIRDWREHGVIGWRAKILAVSAMTGSLCYLWFFKASAIALKIIATVGLAAVSIFILSRKSRRNPS